MCTTFQVDWTSTSSKTTLTKNFNLKWDEWTDRQTDEQTDGQTDRRTDQKHNAHKMGHNKNKVLT